MATYLAMAPESIGPAEKLFWTVNVAVTTLGRCCSNESPPA